MSDKKNYALVDGSCSTIITTNATTVQFEMAIKFAKTLDDYSTEDIVNTLKGAGLLAEYVVIDNEFEW